MLVDLSLGFLLVDFSLGCLLADFALVDLSGGVLLLRLLALRQWTVVAMGGSLICGELLVCCWGTQFCLPFRFIFFR